MRESIHEKAQRLIEDGRVHLPERYRNAAIVCGDSGSYEVWAHHEGVQCTCYGDTAPRPVPRCSHAIAAMVAWYERDEVSMFGRAAAGDQPFVPAAAPRGFADLRTVAV